MLSKHPRPARQSLGSTTSPSGPKICIVLRHQHWRLASRTSSIVIGGAVAKKSFLLWRFTQNALKRRPGATCASAGLSFSAKLFDIDDSSRASEVLHRAHDEPLHQ